LQSFSARGDAIDKRKDDAQMRGLFMVGLRLLYERAPARAATHTAPTGIPAHAGRKCGGRVG